MAQRQAGFAVVGGRGCCLLIVKRVVAGRMGWRCLRLVKHCSRIVEVLMALVVS